MNESPLIVIMIGLAMVAGLIGALLLSESMSAPRPAWMELPREEAIAHLQRDNAEWSAELCAAVADRHVSEWLAQKHWQWGAGVLRLVEGDRVAVGMTREQVRASWGKPDDINKTVTADMVREQWVYWRGRFEGDFLYFRDGILVAIQTD